VVKQVGLIIFYIDSYTFFLAAVDVDGIEVAALYTLQRGLAHIPHPMRVIFYN